MHENFSEGILFSWQYWTYKCFESRWHWCDIQWWNKTPQYAQTEPKFISRRPHSIRYRSVLWMFSAPSVCDVSSCHWLAANAVCEVTQFQASLQAFSCADSTTWYSSERGPGLDFELPSQLLHLGSPWRFPSVRNKRQYGPYIAWFQNWQENKTLTF